MKITKARTFLGLEMDPPKLVFSQREREIMRKAAAIFNAADTMLTDAGIDPDDYDTRGMFIDGWDHARTVAEQGSVELPWVNPV